MGSGGSILAQETQKPLDCSDLTSDHEARDEVVRLRTLLATHAEALSKASDDHMRLTPLETFKQKVNILEAIPMSPHAKPRPNFDNFDGGYAKVGCCFHLCSVMCSPWQSPPRIVY